MLTKEKINALNHKYGLTIEERIILSLYDSNFTSVIDFLAKKLGIPAKNCLTAARKSYYLEITSGGKIVTLHPKGIDKSCYHADPTNASNARDFLFSLFYNNPFTSLQSARDSLLAWSRQTGAPVGKCMESDALLYRYCSDAKKRREALAPESLKKEHNLL